jgi:hypothetical protein
MRAIVSSEESALPEEAECYLSVAPQDQKDGSIWYGHPLQISAHLKDGTHISLRLSFTETAELFALLRDSQAAHFVRHLIEDNQREASD